MGKNTWRRSFRLLAIDAVRPMSQRMAEALISGILWLLGAFIQSIPDILFWMLWDSAAAKWRAKREQRENALSK